MFVLALIFFTNVALQLGHGNSELTERCYCEDPTLSTIWGKFEGAGFCEGGCVGTQVGTRECYLNPKENLVHDKKVLCDITRVCWHPEQCDGAWTTWSNVGSCQSNCLQNQSRICYRNGTFFRSRNCNGSLPGQTEQMRLNPCFDANCIRERITTTTVVTTTTTSIADVSVPVDGDMTTFFTANTNSSIVVRGGANRIVGSAEVEDNDEVTLLSNPEPEENNTILLIAILGSVGLVCLVVVTLGLAVVITKRKKNKAGATTVTHITSGDATILHSIKNPSYESYETIGPALPERPPIRLPPAPKTLDSIYEPEPDCISKAEKEFEARKQTLDAENYLLPLPIPYTTSEDHSGDEEVVYCNIDENGK